jgi:hypothetical protein
VGEESGHREIAKSDHPRHAGRGRVIREKQNQFSREKTKTKLPLILSKLGQVNTDTLIERLNHRETGKSKPMLNRKKI